MTNAFGYNGLDTRVSKTDSTGSYGFKRNGAGVTDPVLSDGAATYTPGISERLIWQGHNKDLPRQRQPRHAVREEALEKRRL